jgi:transposase-like protein
MSDGRRCGEKESYWREVLGRHADSGLSVREFCEREGVKQASLYAWRRRVAERDGKIVSRRTSPSPAPQPAFVPALLTCTEPHAGTIRIELADGTQLRAPASIDPLRLAELVGALAQRGGR